MKFDFSVLAAATALIGSATAAPQNILTGNQPTQPPPVIGLRGPMPPRLTGTASAPVPLPRNGPLSPGPAASVLAVTAVLVDGEAAMDTVLSVTSATAQTLAGVLGAPVLGLPDLGPLGGVEATALTAPGLASTTATSTITTTVSGTPTTTVAYGIRVNAASAGSTTSGSSGSATAATTSHTGAAAHVGVSGAGVGIGAAVAAVLMLMKYHPLSPFSSHFIMICPAELESAINHSCSRRSKSS
ncbi:hypothetical protein KCU96_g22, partial [Aureobasidium melanogenum]